MSGSLKRRRGGGANVASTSKGMGKAYRVSYYQVAKVTPSPYQ